MRLVKVERTTEGFSLDPTEYLGRLAALAADLPPGAAAFATDPDHYDFHGDRCVKDLKLDRMTVSDRHGILSVELSFTPNRFKHDAGLVIAYSDVRQISVDVTSESMTENVWPETRRLGDLQLDELLPHRQGCSHEIQLTGGTILLVAGDLAARWQPL